MKISEMNADQLAKHRARNVARNELNQRARVRRMERDLKQRAHDKLAAEIEKNIKFVVVFDRTIRLGFELANVVGPFKTLNEAIEWTETLEEKQDPNSPLWTRCEIHSMMLPD